MACIKGALRSASVAFAPDSPYLAAGTMAGAVDLSFSSSANLEVFKLDFQSDEWELPVVGECASSERFSRLSWGKPGPGSKEYALGLIAGGLVDGGINIWNPLRLMSSKVAEGSLVASLQKHTGPGVGSGAQGEVSFLAWNHKVQHILASTSYNGTTVIWDLKRQKPVISFSDSIRRRCSVLQWNPDIATQLIVASDDDRFPSLRVWDMRNTISPMKEFVGHSKGVIAMSWCPNDSSFLLTCAKDNRTLCWDTVTGEIISELPASTNWNFDIHWYPKIPGVISASSFDGKIGIYNIEACSRLSSAETDFGSASMGGPPVHLRAPKWLKCPVGVDFGFGGKLASFRPSAGAPGTSEVHVHNLVTESNLVNRSTEFEAAMRNGDKAALRALCETKSEEAQSEDDRETWGFLKVMFDIEGIARTELRKHLGFAGDVNAIADSDLSKKMEESLSLGEHMAGKADEGVSLLGKGIQDTLLDNGEDFFNNLESPKAEAFSASEGVIAGDTSVPNGEKIQNEAGLDESESSLDEAIQHSLIIGDYKEAVSHCMSANRMADALVISHWGGLWESTRDQYLKRSHSSYIKVLAALVGNDLLTLVNVRPLSSWKETLALLCTYARGEEWSLLCDTLASRLMVGGHTLAATLCYICAGNIDKTVEIWSRNLKDNYNGKSYVDHLQDMMEKTVVLALATEQKNFSTSLTKLVENYAELLASQGLLTTAMEYLKLLRTEGSSNELAILQDRIAFAMEEKEGPKTSHFDSTASQQMPVYGNVQAGSNRIDGSEQYYQDNAQPQSPFALPSNAYGEGYQQPFAPSYGTNYHPVHSKQQFQDYTNQSFQSTGAPQMFVPQQVPQAQQMHYAPSVAASPEVKPFNPAPPPALKHMEQYQQPTLASHLYPGNSTASFQVGMPGSVPHGAGASQPTPFMPNQIMTPASAAKGFMPVTNTGFVQKSSQPSSPTHVAEAQPTAASSASTQSVPPTVETVDTSNVSAQMRPVVETLRRLYEETSRILGAPNAVTNRRREIDDNSRRLGSLFAKLNSEDISPNAATKLVQLCQALDKGDFSGALHIQVLLTTSDWDECNFWLSPLKRMIKLRQNAR
ncbi:transport protein SEC31-like protein B [Nymphaea thermarum]|nr:transport protein SEC31-like protein B [Nymphaea thermarum]